MATIPVFRMTAPRLDRDQFAGAARLLGLRGDPRESDDAVAVQDDARVLARAGQCARFPGLLLFLNHAGSLGALHDKPLSPQRAASWLESFLQKAGLEPGRPTDERIALELEPWSRLTEAVVFDGKERKRRPARTDAGVRLRLNGVLVSGPRTRIRAVFGAGEQPLFLHIAVWDRLEVHEEAELVREHDALLALERTLSSRTECGSSLRVHDIRLAYAATDEFAGSPDLLAPHYFVEIDVPRRNDRATAADPGLVPRQLLRIPAWRSPSPGTAMAGEPAPGAAPAPVSTPAPKRSPRTRARSR